MILNPGGLPRYLWAVPAHYVDITPASAKALGEAFVSACSVRLVGTQSLSARIEPPPGDAQVVSTAALSDLEIRPPDLVAQVGAGLPLSELHARLRAQGLVWPVERLEPNGTVGGLIASGRGSVVHPSDFPVSRWILGTRIMLPTGALIEVGGSTIKNSSGYGLTHAMWGSMGRLGALVAVTLRLRHVVPEDALATDRCHAIAQVLSLPCEVRAEELPANWGTSEWDTIAPNAPRVMASDGTRALVGCPNTEVASKVASEIRCRGGWAAVDRPPGKPLGLAKWRVLTTALDPKDLLV